MPKDRESAGFTEMGQTMWFAGHGTPEPSAESPTVQAISNAIKK